MNQVTTTCEYCYTVHVQGACPLAKPVFNPELDEATATALAVLINNHIEALRAWERKLRGPYMPITRSHLSVAPKYGKPTLTSALHVARSGSTFALELTRAVAAFVKAEKGKG